MQLHGEGGPKVYENVSNFLEISSIFMDIILIFLNDKINDKKYIDSAR